MHIFSDSSLFSKRIFTFLCLFWCTMLPSLAQMDGIVYDAATNEPLVGAAISWGQSGTVTDRQGRFQVPSPLPDTLNVSFLGYVQQTVYLNAGQESVVVALVADLSQLAEVVVSAYSHSRKLLETSGAVSVMGPIALKRDNDAFIAPALNRIPGVYMHNGTLSTSRITIRGIGSRSLFSTNRLRAYFNEIPLSSGDGETTVEDIDLSLLDRVEVIKGPASSTYGAGLGGTMRLVAARAPFGETSVQSAHTFGSYGLYRNTTAFRTGGENLNLNLVYNNMESDGYRENNQYNRESLTVMAQVMGGSKTTVSFLGNFISLKAFIPSAIDSATFANNPRAAAANWRNAEGFEDYDKLLTGISLQHQFNSAWENTTAVFATSRVAYEPRPFNILRENTVTYGARTKFTWNPVADNGGRWLPQIIFGGEYFREVYAWSTYRILPDRSRGNILADNQEKRIFFNVFSSLELDITPKTTLSAGLNFNQTQYNLEDFFAQDSLNFSGDYRFDGVLSPRLALNHRIAPQVALYAQVAHGFSPPSVEETLTPEGQVNPEIQPETGINFEVGSKGSLLNNRLQYDLAIYSMRVRNLLVARRTAEDAFVGVNAGRTTHNGLEATLNYLLTPKNSRVFELLQTFATYTLAAYKFDEFTDRDNDFSGNRLTGVPPHVFNLGVDAQTHMGFYGNLNAQWVDAAPMRDDNTVYNDAYFLLNAKIGFQKMPMPWLVLDLNAGIANLTDERYAGMILINAEGFGNSAPRYYYPGLPRNFFGGFSLKIILD